MRRRSRASRSRRAARARASPRRRWPPRRDQRVSGQGDREEPREAGAAGFDVTEGRRAAARSRSTGPASVASSCAALGQARGGPTARPQVAAQRRARRSQRPAADRRGHDAAYDVWTRYDAVPDDGKEQYVEQYERIARQYPKITKLGRLGKTHLGRDIWRSRSRKDAKTTPTARARRCSTTRSSTPASGSPARPAGARSTTSSTTTATTAQVTRLVDSRELWFFCISNPDGYEYTFTDGNRLWRKNMADNDGDGVRGEAGDGVDPNRNFATNWGLRRGGRVATTRLGDLPRRGAGLRAGDQGDEGPLGPRRLRVPEERPHGGRAAAVSAGLPAVHAHAGQRRSSPRWPATTPTAIADKAQRGRSDRTIDGREPLRPGPLGRAVHHQRRHARRRLPRARHPRLHARGLRAARRRTSPASSSRTTRTRSRRSSCATCCSRSTSPSRRPTRRTRTSHIGNTTEAFYVDRSRTPTAIRSRRGDRQALAGHRQAALPHQRRHACGGADQGGRAASGTTTTRASTTTACAAWSKGTKPGDNVEVWFEGAAASASSPLHLRGGQRDRRARC